MAKPSSRGTFSEARHRWWSGLMTSRCGGLATAGPLPGRSMCSNTLLAQARLHLASNANTSMRETKPGYRPISLAQQDDPAGLAQPSAEMANAVLRSSINDLSPGPSVGSITLRRFDPSKRSGAFGQQRRCGGGIPEQRRSDAAMEPGRALQPYESS